jgi:hypothetical protein
MMRAMKTHLLAALLALPLAALAADPAPARPGYTNTPALPGQPWIVHDANRPYPPVVTPGDTCGAPPSDAVVLLDGTSLARWKSSKGGDANWKLENGYMEAAPKAGNIVSRDEFGDCQLHIEWASPAEVKGESQGRGNSGVFLMGVYEVQVLDSYNTPTYADGQAASIYGQFPPLVNATRKPGEWQVYDIVFEAPRFAADGKLEKPAYVTVLHNGVVVQHRREILGRGTHKQVATYARHGDKGPISLQDHGNPVRFRNIWVRPLDLTAK